MKWFRGLVCWAVCMHFAAGAVLGLMAKIPLRDLVVQSDRIVFGVLVDKNVVHIGKNFYTDYTLRVEGTILGDDRETVSFRLFGGEIPGEGGCWYSDRPVFREGERVLVMLKDDPEFPVVGHFQGKYTIRDNMVLENGLSFFDFTEQIERVIWGVER